MPASTNITMSIIDVLSLADADGRKETICLTVDALMAFQMNITLCSWVPERPRIQFQD